MAIDPFTEEMFSLQDAAKKLPPLRAGRPVNVSTIWRWVTNGYKGIKLETINIGERTMTSTDAMSRFFQEITEATISSRGKKPKRRN